MSEIGDEAPELAVQDLEGLEDAGQNDDSTDGVNDGYTQQQLDHIDAIEKEATELFPPGDRSNVFDTALDLKRAFQQTIGDKYGFKIENNGR